MIVEILWPIIGFVMFSAAAKARGWPCYPSLAIGVLGAMAAAAIVSRI